VQAHAAQLLLQCASLPVSLQHACHPLQLPSTESQSAMQTTSWGSTWLPLLVTVLPAHAELTMLCCEADMQDYVESRVASGAKWTWSTLRCASCFCA